MKELWLDIEGWEGLYRISTFGRVYSVRRKKIRKIDKSYWEYLSVILLGNGIRKRKTIHRLVATAFIPNPENKKEVNHKDGNKENNYVENLEWVTPLENVAHEFANELCLKPGDERRSDYKGYINILDSDDVIVAQTTSFVAAAEWLCNHSTTLQARIAHVIYSAYRRGKVVYGFKLTRTKEKMKEL
ncbi:hypothetical protein FACS1894161_2370 [Spirochaetia bacterium]|nr:hypothetical protein FACS1894161_2370 [Spirochaetia bacterium]